MKLEEFMKDTIKIQKEYKKLKNSKKLTKKAICDLVVPFRDKYNLSDLEALMLTREEKNLTEIMELWEKIYLTNTRGKRSQINVYDDACDKLDDCYGVVMNMKITQNDFYGDENLDPIHVAGGIYCEECVYYKSYEFPESNKKIYQCYNQCASYLEERKPYDFCSRGKKK